MEFYTGNGKVINGNHFDLHIVLPSKLRTIVLNQLHNTMTGGHLGIRKTLSKVKEIYLV